MCRCEAVVRRGRRVITADRKLVGCVEGYRGRGVIGRRARYTTDDLLAHPLDSKRQAGRPAALFFAGGTWSLFVALVAAAAYARPLHPSAFGSFLHGPPRKRSRIFSRSSQLSHSYLPRRVCFLGVSKPFLCVHNQALLIVKIRNVSGPAASDHEGRGPFLSPTVDNRTPTVTTPYPREKH